MAASAQPKARLKLNPRPLRHGGWWTIRLRKNSQDSTRIRVRIAPVIGVDGKPTPVSTVKQLINEYVQPLNDGLEATARELAIYRADPPNAPHANFVVCLECGQKRASIATTHLQAHGLTWVSYQKRWPGAAMYCEASHAARNRASLKFQKKHYAAHREEINAVRRSPAGHVKANRAARRRRAAKRTELRAYSRDLARKKVPRASQEELDLFLKSPDLCDYVVCLEPECRAKLRNIGANHIQKIHGLTVEGYEEKHPGAPLRWRKKISKPGRRPKTPLFIEAEKLDSIGRSWPQIAEILLPADCARYGRKATGEKLRVGVARLKKSRTKSTS